MDVVNHVAIDTGSECLCQHWKQTLSTITHHPDRCSNESLILLNVFSFHRYANILLSFLSLFTTINRGEATWERKIGEEKHGKCTGEEHPEDGPHGRCYKGAATIKRHLERDNRGDATGEVQQGRCNMGGATGERRDRNGGWGYPNYVNSSSSWYDFDRNKLWYKC